MINSMALSSAVSPDPLLGRLISAFCRDLGSNVAKEAERLFNDRKWLDLAQLSIDPREYDSALRYFIDVIPTSLKSCIDIPIDASIRRENTSKKWIYAERKCFETNQRLYRYKKGYTQYSQSDNDIYHHIDGIRKIIRSWIGDGPSSRPELAFSPGSTITERASRATIAHKIRKSPSSTPQLDAIGYPGFIGTLWHHNMVDGKMKPRMFRGGKYFTVPKKCTVERPAEMQPTLNISLQKGIGLELRKEFKKNTQYVWEGISYPGWDLTKAQEIHREVAKRASVDLSFCTIDLSSASDMQARILVEILLPDRWFRRMDGLRTHHIKGSPLNPKGYYLMEKFSSMGNGFTFELETIIFAAICCYVTRLNGFFGQLGFDVFVFGDDIIVRDELYDDVKAILLFLGFEVNQGKSFHGKHPFRESCGGDYFSGRNVRPFSVEELPSEVPEYFSLANQIKHCSERLEDLNWHFNLNSAWFTVLNEIPSGFRGLRGPARFGDIVLYDPFREKWITRQRDGSVEVQTLGFRELGYLNWGRFDPATVLACATLGVGNGVKGILPRDSKKDLTKHWTILESLPGV